MNKQKYLAELAGLLSFLSEEDRETVLNHYTRRFDRAGQAGEAELIRELGTPMRLAITLNRQGMEAILEAEEAEEPEAAEETQETQETEAAEETEKPEEAPEETEEKLETAELIRAVLEESEEDAPRDEEDEREESAVTDEIEEVRLTPEPEEVPEEPKPEAEAEAEPEAEPEPEARPAAEDFHRESFPELTVARGMDRPDETETEKPRLSIGGAILFWILMILPGLPLLVLSVVLIPVLLAPGIAAAWAGVVGLRAGMTTLVYLPDAMFVFGGALLLLGAAILLLMLAAWLLGCILRAWKNGVPALWGRLARKESRT